LAQKRKKQQKQGNARSDGSGRKPLSAAPELSRTERSVLWAVGAFVVLRGIAAAAPTGGLRLWGIDFFSVLDGALPLLLAWLPLLFIFPAVARLFTGRSGAAAGDTDSGGAAPVRLTLALLLTVAAGAVAMTVHVSYAFLGDGTWYPAELYRSMNVSGYANSMIKPSAWLTGLLIDAGARMFQPDDLRLPFVVADAAGAVIATAAVLFATLKERSRTTGLAMLLLLGSSGSLIFLGYIELYALVYALSIAYFMTAWQCLRGRNSVWLPGALLFAAILFGASAVVWIPSYLLLLHWKFRGEEGAFPLRRAAVVLMLLPLAGIAVLYVAGGGSGDSAYLVPLTPYERIVDGLSTGWQRYVLTAPERWADLLNALFLTMGAMIFVLPVLLFSARRKQLLSAPPVLFGATAAAGGFTLLIFGNTFLGLARDWDVAAFAVLGGVFLLFVLILVLDERSSQRVRLFLPALAAAVLSQLALWVMVNTDEEASAERFEQIASMDAGILLPMNTFTAWENLRKFYRSGGEGDAYFRVMRRLIETGYRRDVSYEEYLSSVLRLRDADAAAREWRWLMDTLLEDARTAREGDRGDSLPADGRKSDARSAQDDARPEASSRFFREFAARALLSAWQVKRRDIVLEYMGDFSTMLPSWPERGLLNLLVQPPADETQAAAMLSAATDEDTRDAFLLMTAGSLYHRYGLLDRAARYYDRALEREPSTYPSWYLVAARFHLDVRRDTARARSLLEACIEHAPSSDEAGTAASLLQTLP